MRWENLRKSENNKRRRGGGGKGIAMGGGIGAIVMALIAIFIMKKPLNQVMSEMAPQQGETFSIPYSQL